MTTNKGIEKKQIGFNTIKANITEELKETFNIAFLNRIDDTILFNNLTKQDIDTITKSELNKLKDKFKEVEITLSKNIYEEITDESNYKEFGARKIEKIIKNRIENIIIDNMINNNYKVNIDSILST